MASTDPGSPRPSRPLPERMREDLTRALKARDQRSVNVLRTTLAAIANAEAPPAPAPSAPTAPVVGQLVEHARLELSDADLQQIVRHEIADRQDTIDRYLAGGRGVEAEPLVEELVILRSYVD